MNLSAADSLKKRQGISLFLLLLLCLKYPFFRHAYVTGKGEAVN
jgi:hypothetical protein